MSNRGKFNTGGYVEITTLTRIKSIINFHIYTILSRMCQKIPIMFSLSTHEANNINPSS